jgi:translation initiation factor 3 subunit F
MIGHASDPGGAPAAQDEGAALQHSMEKLLSMLETCSEYVDGVVDGSISPDDEVGRDISETLNSVPRIRPEVFDKMFNDSLQDLLMVTYLSNITKTQLLIAEKLNETLGK